MTYEEIAQMIESIGLPYAYYQFPDDTQQAPPFICFLYDYDEFYADDSNYAQSVVLTIELYTDTKDIPLESAVEAVLDENEMTWSKESTYIDSERMWQTSYSMEVFING